MHEVELAVMFFWEGLQSVYCVEMYICRELSRARELGIGNIETVEVSRRMERGPDGEKPGASTSANVGYSDVLRG